MLMPESVAVPVSAAVDQNTSETPTVAADLSVWSTLTVPPPRPVSTSTVLILVPEFVASMPSVGSSITILSVPVCLVTLETHLEAAVLNVSTKHVYFSFQRVNPVNYTVQIFQPLQLSMIHVTPTHVVLEPYPDKLGTSASAPVLQACLETHTENANQNVS